MLEKNPRIIKSKTWTSKFKHW